MKKSILFLFIAIFGTANGQITGKFEWLQGREYFVMNNSTYYNYTISFTLVNENKQQQRTHTVTIYACSSLSIGPSTYHWTWEKGEKIYITYSDGTRSYWVCPTTDPSGQNNPPFGKTPYYGSCCHCRCQLYKPFSKGNSYCQTCAAYGCKSTWTSHEKCYR